MQHFLPLDQIAGRAAAIRLGKVELAALAGLHHSTFNRAERGGDMRTSNAVRLTEALVAAERKIFDHLAATHPEWLSAPQREAAE